MTLAFLFRVGCAIAGFITILISGVLLQHGVPFTVAGWFLGVGAAIILFALDGLPKDA